MSRLFVFSTRGVLLIGILNIALVHNDIAPGILAITAGLLGVIRLSRQVR